MLFVASTVALLPAQTAVAQDEVTLATDFDGDSMGDIASYHPSSARFVLRGSATGLFARIALGSVGDYPASGDFNGDSLADLAAYHTGLGLWSILLNGADEPLSVSFGSTGGAGAVPVPGRYSRTSCTDLALYHPKSRIWSVRDCGGDNEVEEFFLGRQGSVPAPADYDCDGKTDPAVYDRTAREWFIRRSSDGRTQRFVFGLWYDMPVSADFVQGGSCGQPALYRPTTKDFIIGSSVADGGAPDSASFKQWGLPGDIPSLINVDGDDAADFSIYRPLFGQFFVSTSNQLFFQVPFAVPGSVLADQALLQGPFNGPAPAFSATDVLQPLHSPQNVRYRIRGDYNGDGLAELVVARVERNLSRTLFFIRYADGSIDTHQVNAPGDAIVPGDYNGDGKTQAAVVFVNAARQPTANLEWHVRNPDGSSTLAAFGQNGDTPLTGDFDCDGKDDRAVVRNEGASRLWLIDTSGPSDVTPKLFGLANDSAWSADVNGDGCDELIVSREQFGGVSWFHQQLSDDSGTYTEVQWGLAGDAQIPPSDMDGDGKADFMVSRPNAAGGVDTFIRRSAEGVAIVPFGLSCDVVLSGAFSGAYRHELAVYRRSTGSFYLGLLSGQVPAIPYGNPASDILVRPDGTAVPPNRGEVCGSGGGGGGPFSCDLTTDFVDGGGNRVWKPVSENTRQPVFLLESRYCSLLPRDGTDRVDVFDAAGNEVGEAFRTCSHNQNRYHHDVRIRTSGSLTVVLRRTDGVTECVEVPNASQRYD